MKKKLIAVLLVVALITGLFPFHADSVFPKTYGMLLSEIGLVNGSNGDLREKEFINREAFMTLLNRISQSQSAYQSFKAPAVSSFKDVPLSHWAYRDIEYAKSSGLTQGIGGGKFGMGAQITYEQACTFLGRALGIDTSKNTYNDILGFLLLEHDIDLSGLDGEGTTVLNRSEVFYLLARALVHNPVGSDKSLYEILDLSKGKLSFADFSKLAEEATVIGNYSISTFKIDADTSNKFSDSELKALRMNELVYLDELTAILKKVQKSGTEGSLSDVAKITKSISQLSDLAYRNPYGGDADEMRFSTSFNMSLENPFNVNFKTEIESEDGYSSISGKFIDIKTLKDGNDTYYVLLYTYRLMGDSKLIPILFTLKMTNGKMVKAYHLNEGRVGTIK